MVSASSSTYRTITEIEEEMAAQILLVVGTDEGGLKHPNWRENLTLAVHLQKRLTEDYPLLAQSICDRSDLTSMLPSARLFLRLEQVQTH